MPESPPKNSPSAPTETSAPGVFARDIVKHAGWLSVVINLFAATVHFLHASYLEILWGPVLMCETNYRITDCVIDPSGDYAKPAALGVLFSFVLAVLIIAHWRKNRELSDEVCD